MDSSSQGGGGGGGGGGEKKAVTVVKVFPVPFALGEKKENITITTNTPATPSGEQIINQAFKFHSQGNIQEAAKYYQLFINQGFKDHRVFSNCGIILKKLGKSKEAEFLFRKAIEIKPNYANAHLSLGNILRDLGKLQDAELSYRKAIGIKPDYAEAHSNLGNTLKDLGKLQDAELSYRKAIGIKPDYAEAYFNLGSILKDLKQLDNAISNIDKASELGMDSKLCLCVIGNVLLEQGNHAEGIKKLKAGEGAILFNLKHGLSFN